MTRPITLCTGQWADPAFEEVCRLASGWGYDGLEIACWGDPLDVWQAVEDDAYLAEKRAVLAKYDLEVWTVSNHLKGQAVCDDPIDQRHQEILSGRIWVDGDPEGVRQRAAEEMKMTARAARRLVVDTVVGFTGSSNLEVRREVPAGHRGDGRRGHVVDPVPEVPEEADGVEGLPDEV